MGITVMKVFYKKQKSKTIPYRSYKNFDYQVFQRELNSELLKSDLNNADLSEFTETFLSLLIHFNLRVARNGRFGVRVYSGGGTMVVKILDFGFSESLKTGLSRNFYSHKLSLGG